MILKKLIIGEIIGLIQRTQQRVHHISEANEEISLASYRLSSPLTIQQNATVALRASANLISMSCEGNTIMIHL